MDTETERLRKEAIEAYEQAKSDARVPYNLSMRPISQRYEEALSNAEFEYGEASKPVAAAFDSAQNIAARILQKRLAKIETVE